MRKAGEFGAALWRVVVSVYGRIHNGRPAIIVSPDPPRNILRVRKKAVDTVRGDLVPPGHAPHHRPHETAGHRTHARGPEVLVELVPGVPHRRMAIADVHRALGHDHRLHGAVAAADDQVEALEVEQPHGERIERQVMAVEPRRAGSACTNEVRIGRASMRDDTDPGTRTRVVSGASGKISQTASRTFSPPRMPVSQSWTRATRRPAVALTPQAPLRRSP